GLDRGNEHVIHLYEQKLEPTARCLPGCHRGPRDVPACGAGEHQQGRRLVELVREVEIVKGGLALTAATAARDAAGVANAHGEGGEHDLVLVLGVGRLTGDAIDL